MFVVVVFSRVNFFIFWGCFCAFFGGGCLFVVVFFVFVCMYLSDSYELHKSVVSHVLIQKNCECVFIYCIFVFT